MRVSCLLAVLHSRSVPPLCCLGLWLAGTSVWAQAPAPGSLDGTFTPVLSSYLAGVRAVLPEADGHVLVGGDFTKAGGLARPYLARFGADGSLDQTFMSVGSPDGQVRSLVFQPDGRLLIGGDFSQLGLVGWKGLGRLLANGNPDPGFANFSGLDYGHINVVLVQPDGKILLGGYFGKVNGVGRACLARVSPDGTLDGGFAPAFDAEVRTLALRPNGQILVGGLFSQVGSVTRWYLAQLGPDGTLDTSFAPTLNMQVECLALQTNGQVLVGGWFSSVNGASQNSIARLNVDGSRDANFKASTGGIVYSLVPQPDGKLLVGGRFSELDNATHPYFGRLTPDGLLDTSFVTGGGADGTVTTLALQPDGRVLLGGAFANVDGSPRPGLARVYGDPIGQPVPLMQIVTAVEIGWTSSTSCRYQVQWAPEAAPGQWQNLGSPVPGNGTTNWALDSVRGSARKFYRVLQLQP